MRENGVQYGSERLFGTALEVSMGLIFERNVRPVWLPNPLTGALMELDLYNAKRRLARDRAKDELCAERGVLLVRVRCVGSPSASRTAEEVRECVARLVEAGMLPSVV